MIYELRTYWAAPGKIGALHTRFRELTLGLFERHAMQVIGFWTPAPVTDSSGDLVYILAFSDQDALERAWNGFRSDPDWQAGKAASETNGALTAKVTSTIMQPTSYSPLQ